MVMPGEEAGAAIFEATQEMLNAAGFPAYEISNHARPGQECRHNLTYWRYGDYLGVGPGAHGRITLASPGAARGTARGAVRPDAESGGPIGRLLGKAAARCRGADIVRVHDVKEMVRVCRVTDAVVRGWRPKGWAAD